MTVFALACFLTLATATADSTLRQVNLVYRHGDRSPIVVYPTDPNQEDKWPQGLGWLSKVGMQQHHRLGQWFAERYINTSFMNSTYKRHEIEIHSSDEDRCLMSAYSDLSGMYPPDEAHKFNPDIAWQPIPVHTRPKSEDNMIAMGMACPKYDELYAENLKTHAVKEEEKENKAFYKFIGDKTGYDHENISNIWQVADTLLCEKKHNMTLASWANDTVYTKLRSLFDYSFFLRYEGDEIHRLKGGPLLSQFIQNMQQRVQNSTAVLPKMYMYSGHDSTIVAVQSAMGLYSGISPQYATSFIVELHEPTPNQYTVRLFYKNVTDDSTAYQLTLPGCKADCPFGEFVKLTSPVITKDWRKECGLPPDHGKSSSSSGWNTAWIIVLIEGIAVIVLVALLIVCVCKLRKSQVQYREFTERA